MQSWGMRDAERESFARRKMPLTEDGRWPEKLADAGREFSRCRVGGKAIAGDTSRNALKGQGFMGCGESRVLIRIRIRIPSGAKALESKTCELMYGLKPVPFNAEARALQR
jgi:hypothetical protein